MGLNQSMNPQGVCVCVLWSAHVLLGILYAPVLATPKRLQKGEKSSCSFTQPKPQQAHQISVFTLL